MRAPQGPRLRFRVVVAAAAVLAVVYLLALGFLSLPALDALPALRSIAARTAGQGSITGAELGRAHQKLREAEASLRAVQIAGQPLLWTLAGLGWVPGAGPLLESVPELFQAGLDGLRAGDHALRAAEPIVEAMERGGGRAALLGALAVAEGELHEAAGRLRQVEDRLDRLLAKPGLASVVADPVQRARHPLKRARAGLELGAALPALLGYGRPATYLLLGQNRDELRATGGFISTAGLATLSEGSVKDLDYRDSYAFDPTAPRPSLPPPGAYQRYMLAEDWKLRDANWWPDFPTSARQALTFLWMDHERFVDGVIAFDQTVLQLLLEAVGPIRVDPFDQVVEAGNVIEIVEAYTHPTGYKEGHVAPEFVRVAGGDRKAFITALANQLRQRIEALEGRRLLELLRRLVTSLNEKHLLIYLEEPELRGTVRELGWDGALASSTDGDYLMLAESNVSFNKANRHVQRSLHYQLTVGPAGVPELAQVTIQFRNTNDEPARHCSAADIDFATSDDSCYKSYLRLYVPAGSLPLGGSGLVDGPEWFTEGNKTVLAGLLVLPPGESRTVRLSYKPPRAIGGEPYQLQVQKQAGLDQLPLTVTVCRPEGNCREVTRVFRTDGIIRFTVMGDEHGEDR